MVKHAWLPLRIVVILAIRVKIIIRKQRKRPGGATHPGASGERWL